MMRVRPYSGIYALVNPKGELYVGQSWDIIERFKHYRRGHGTHKLALSIKKYGYEHHLLKVLYTIPANSQQSFLNALENFFYTQFKESGIKLLNVRIANGARGKFSDGERLNMKIKMTGKPKSETHRLNISRAGKGRVFSEEHKKNMAAAGGRMTGKKHSEETKAKIREAGKKRIQSQESIEKMRATKTGKKHSPEHNRKIALSLIGNTRTKGMKKRAHTPEAIENMRNAAFKREQLKRERV